jgi:uncharacterized protein
MLRFLARFLNVLIVLLLVRLVLRAIAAWLRGPQQRPSGRPVGPPAPHEAGELVRDRVCNTFLPRDRAIRALVAGTEEHFCSAACRDRALAEARQAS